MDPGTPMKTYLYDDIIIMTQCHHYLITCPGPTNVIARESPSHHKKVSPASELPCLPLTILTSKSVSRLNKVTKHDTTSRAE